MTTDNLTPEEIREGNMIVAEYMGWRPFGNETDMLFENIHDPNSEYRDQYELQYNDDWREMIPAWAKAQEEMQYIISNSTYYTATKQRADFYEAINADNKPSAFRTLVAAIKLLNEKTK